VQGGRGAGWSADEEEPEKISAVGAIACARATTSGSSVLACDVPACSASSEMGCIMARRDSSCELVTPARRMTVSHRQTAQGTVSEGRQRCAAL
jgi:hypothetical protein